MSASEEGYSLEEALAQGRRPTVFMWQPIRFELVPSERLHEWETLIREEIGLPVAAVRRGGGSATLSATLPDDCMDDSDYLSE